MKKTYSKPDIMFDSFSMNTNIASGCGMITKLPTQGVCGYQPDRSNFVVFTSSMTSGDGACTYPEDDGEYNGICYHVPTSDDSLFSS